MVLWKKESCDNACYIDLLSSNEIGLALYEQIKALYGNRQKSESVSLERRTEGNELFQAKKLAEAMVKYNESICYAPNGSESLGLGYANRSACFLHMKMYDKCLADIELAKNANYPPHLMHKLDDRKAACLKAMKERVDMDEKVIPPQLSYSPNTKFPGMADILEVRTNDEFGKHVVAKRDIDVGKIVLLEDAFAFGKNRGCDIYICKACAKSCMNFIPCPNCVDVMFCNAKCMKSNDMHEETCGALYNRSNNINVETILVAVSAFPNAGSLMKFVKAALATRDIDSPECETDLQAKYRLFLKLFVSPKLDTYMMKQGIVLLYKLALEIPRIEQFFRSKQEKRFLMHLIGQHHCILTTNGVGISDASADPCDVGMVGICSSLFNHSCAPNILHVQHGNKMVGYVQRPVKKGEQLFIDYFKGQINKSHAQKALNFRCRCSKCVPCWKQEDCLRIKSDADYSYFERSNVETSDFDDRENRLVFKSKLQILLTKYGRLPWSPEFELMEIGYYLCCNKELSTWDY